MLWTIDRLDYSDQSGLPFLSPGNDTRINLAMLAEDPVRASLPATLGHTSGASLFSVKELEEAHSWHANPAATDDPSRCQSQAGGTAAFTAAVARAAGLSDREREQLAAARVKLVGCDNKTAYAATELSGDLADGSPEAKAYTTYLVGAEAFYRGAFADSVAAFAALSQAQDSWLRETARYMIGRALLNKAQESGFETFDMVGQPLIKEAASLAQAQRAFDDYLAAYPAGIYAASAQGLLRRVFWLGEDAGLLSGAYETQLQRGVATSDASRGVDLAWEIDAKLFANIDFADPAKLATHPLLLAAWDLKLMRNPPPAKTFTADALDGQAPTFAARPDLYAFLKAARAHYVDRDGKAALAALGAPVAEPSTYLEFSREMLRGQALLAQGEMAAAAAHWRALLSLTTDALRKEAIELGLALTWQRSGTIYKAFQPETRIGSERIRAILLSQTAGPILLRMAINDPKSSPAERDFARDTLLFKTATRGQYANFLRDYDADALRMPEARLSKVYLWNGSNDPYPCPSLKAVVEGLAANPKSSSGQICLAEFVRKAGLDSHEDERPGTGELGGGKSIFPGQPYSRLESYKKLIANRATPPSDVAYALFRAIRCYGPSGVNRCGGVDVPVSQRKAWFQTLKIRYGSTPWAKRQSLYW